MRQEKNNYIPSYEIDTVDKIRYWDGHEWIEGEFIKYWGHTDDPYGDSGWIIKKENGYEVWEDIKDIHEITRIK